MRSHTGVGISEHRLLQEIANQRHLSLVRNDNKLNDTASFGNKVVRS